MSRSGYSEYEGDAEDQWRSICWQGAVKSAIRGNRGQQFLKELRQSLDAMPVKELVHGELEIPDGQVCALGQLGKCRGLSVKDVDPEDYEKVAKLFGQSEALIREVVYVNDEWDPDDCDPAKRWETVRRWVDQQINAEQQEQKT
jgi:hypothetical protein